VARVAPEKRKSLPPAASLISREPLGKMAITRTQIGNVLQRACTQLTQRPRISKPCKNRRTITIRYRFGLGSLPEAKIIFPWKQLLRFEFAPELISLGTVRRNFSKRTSKETIRLVGEYAKKEPDNFTEEVFSIVLEANAFNPIYPGKLKARGRLSLYRDFEKRTGESIRLIRLAAKQLYVYLQCQSFNERFRIFQRYGFNRSTKLKEAVMWILEEVFDFEMAAEKEESEKTYTDAETFYRKYIADSEQLKRLRKWSFIKDGRTRILKRILSHQSSSYQETSK
jgi:hypothetical protein